MKQFAPFMLTVFATLFFAACGPNLKAYEHLKDPAITDYPETENMLVVSVVGTPNETAEKGIRTLIKTFFALQHKDLEMTPPRARWPKPFDTPTDEWVGLYALPIPDDITEVPQDHAGEGCTVTVERWKYGKVAEILHTGSYASETPTIEKLKAFIEDEGYAIAGPHEEMYLNKPGPFTPEEKLKTVIRYPVKVKSANAAKPTDETNSATNTK